MSLEVPNQNGTTIESGLTANTVPCAAVVNTYNCDFAEKLWTNTNG